MCESISDSQVLALVGRYLQQRVMDGLDEWTPTWNMPQRAVLTPLLENVYLREMDCTLGERYLPAGALR